MIKHITTENIYWRVFYLLPFPLIAVIASAIIFQRNYEPGKKHVFIATLVLIAIAGFFGPTSVINKSNRGATFEWARFKIPADVYAATMEILSKSPDGPMLSPLD